jgi:hypothetical protein
MAKEAMVQKKNEIATVDDDFLAELEKHAGEGVSRSRADNLVPSIVLAQSLSPFVVDGRAKAGDFFFPTTGRVIPGAEGIWFQPAGHENMWMEFAPRDRGSGFIRTYPWIGYKDGDDGNDPILPDGVRQVKAWPPKYLSAEGNDVTHHRIWPGVFWENGDGIEYVIKLTGTGHTTARNWNFAALTANKLATGNPRPLWSQVYKLTTYLTRKSGNSWHMINVGPPIPIERANDVIPDYRRAKEMGKTLAAAFARREKSAEIEETNVHVDDYARDDRGDDRERARI